MFNSFLFFYLLLILLLLWEKKINTVTELILLEHNKNIIKIDTTFSMECKINNENCYIPLHFKFIKKEDR